VSTGSTGSRVSTVSTHVLDAARGRPGSGIAVQLERLTEPRGEVADGVTDDDGRVADLASDVVAGIYRLTVDTGAYFAGAGLETFFPQVDIVFAVVEPEHYHVPVLLSPFAFSTYRGS
jgi:5-hydroxyisourate hydrolase